MPAGKRRQIYSIDIPIAGAFDAGGDASSVAALAPPVQATIGPPTSLALTTAIEFSAVTPSARIGATWLPPAGVAPSSYIVQWSVSSSFPDPGTTGQGASSEATTISGLIPNTLYYVRVAAVAGNVVGTWSSTASITTASDTTPPSPPTSPAASFQGTGDLVITWVNPTSANFRDTEVVIKASSGGATLATLYNATQQQVWTVAQNLAATSGAGDPTLYVELRARGWNGIFSTTVNTGTITKAAPTAPTISVDFTGPDAVYTITPPSDAAQISFVANTGITARQIGVVGRYVYTFDTNRLDNTTPDPTLAYSFTAIDGLKQASTATSGTATNAAPATPTATLTQGAVSGLYATVTSTPAADFWRYEYVFKRDGTTVATVYSAGSTYRYEMQGAGDEGYHSWTVVIREEDVFAQFSATVTPAAVAFEALTLTSLRAMAAYTDSDGNTAGTLAALKDGITTSGGVSYAA